MRAYAPMYRPIRPTAISGHTRLISGHTMAETYHAILPLLLYTVKQETNEKMKQSDSHSSLLKTLRKWVGNEYYRSLRMAIHKIKKSVYPNAKWNKLKSTFCDGRASARDSVSMGACALHSALMGACALDSALIGACAHNLSFRSRRWLSIVHSISIMSAS